MVWALAPTGLLADPATYPAELAPLPLEPAAFPALEPTAFPADPATCGWVLALSESMTSLMDVGDFLGPPWSALVNPLES